MLKKSLSSILFFCFTICVYCQDYSDAMFLAGLDYMEYATELDCNNTTGANIETKICLNLEFQRIDSVFNEKFILLLSLQKEEAAKKELVDLFNSWVANRYVSSILCSQGFQGHQLGISFLNCLIEETRFKIDKIELLLNDQ